MILDAINMFIFMNTLLFILLVSTVPGWLTLFFIGWMAYHAGKWFQVAIVAWLAICLVAAYTGVTATLA